MHIKSVKLQTFKRFSDLSIVDLSPTARMVIVAGPNGNGKSSLFDAFNSFHHRSLSSLGFDWQPDYHVKKTENPQAASGNVQIDFFETLPSDMAGRRKAFYVRSAYRNDPDFQTRGLDRMGPATDIRRLNFLTDNDAAVSDNYRRIASRAVSELYDESQKAKTYGDFRQETLGDLNKYLNRLWPTLSLTSLGPP
jgi:hypothetical protein